MNTQLDFNTDFIENVFIDNDDFVEDDLNTVETYFTK